MEKNIHSVKIATIDKAQEQGIEEILKGVMSSNNLLYANLLTLRTYRKEINVLKKRKNNVVAKISGNASCKKYLEQEENLSADIQRLEKLCDFLWSMAEEKFVNENDAMVIVIERYFNEAMSQVASLDGCFDTENFNRTIKNYCRNL